MNLAQSFYNSINMPFASLRGTGLDLRNAHHRKKGPGRKHVKRPAVVLADEITRKIRRAKATAVKQINIYKAVPNWVSIKGRVHRLCSVWGSDEVTAKARGNSVVFSGSAYYGPRKVQA